MIKFSGKLEKVIYCSANFKIYKLRVSKKKYPDLKYDKVNLITIVGDLPMIEADIEYTIEGTEKYNNKFGYQYTVDKISRNKPTTLEESRKFLSAILTPRQANILLKPYPNIIDMIMNNEEIDLSLTKGIKSKSFDKIKTRIIEDFCLLELVNEFCDYGLTLTMMKNMYEKYKSVDKIREMMKEEPYQCLCNLARVGFLTADATILKITPSMINCKQRCIACIDYSLDKNEEDGHTYITKSELYNMIYDVAKECIEHFDEIILFGDDIHVEDNKISKKYTYECEKYISDKITEMLRIENRLNIDWRSYKNLESISLTHEQLNALKNLCENKISMLFGVAGSGKSQTVRAIIDMLEDSKLKYNIFTPTGKSSKVVSKYVDREATTCHRGLAYNPTTGWGFNEENPLNCDVLIVDEFGMFDIFLTKRLFEAINMNKTRILFIFDCEQIPSISCGKVSYDMLESDVIPKTTLTKVFRYAEGGLHTIATNMREGKRFIDNKFVGIKNYGTAKDYSLVSVPQEQSIAYMKNIYQKLLKDGESVSDIAVITIINKGDYGATIMNKIIQEMVNPPKETTKEIKYGDNIYRVNDKVMQIVNNYQAQNNSGDKDTIFNGDMGIIKDIRDNSVLIDYGDKKIIYSKEGLNQIQLAYAINIYKMQGSQAKHIIFMTPTAHKFFINKNLLYTGVTRAEQRVFHICTTDVINSALGKNANYSRNTLLKTLLTNGNKSGIL